MNWIGAWIATWERYVNRSDRYSHQNLQESFDLERAFQLPKSSLHLFDGASCSKISTQVASVANLAIMKLQNPNPKLWMQWSRLMTMNISYAWINNNGAAKQGMPCKQNGACRDARQTFEDRLGFLSIWAPRTSTEASSTQKPNSYVNRIWMTSMIFAIKRKNAESVTLWSH